MPQTYTYARNNDYKHTKDYYLRIFDGFRRSTSLLNATSFLRYKGISIEAAHRLIKSFNNPTTRLVFLAASGDKITYYDVRNAGKAYEKRFPNTRISGSLYS